MISTTDARRLADQVLIARAQIRRVLRRATSEQDQNELRQALGHLDDPSRELSRIGAPDFNGNDSKEKR